TRAAMLYADRAGPAGVAGREWRGKDVAGREVQVLGVFFIIAGICWQVDPEPVSADGSGVSSWSGRISPAGNERRKCRVEFAASGAGGTVRRHPGMLRSSCRGVRTVRTEALWRLQGCARGFPRRTAALCGRNGDRR